MSTQLASLSDDLRKEVFAALVKAQDEGVSVKESRLAVAAQFGLSPEQVEKIEREGLDQQWPPLS